jgi:hypothetical protein
LAVKVVAHSNQKTALLTPLLFLVRVPAEDEAGKYISPFHDLPAFATEDVSLSV